MGMHTSWVQYACHLIEHVMQCPTCTDFFSSANKPLGCLLQVCCRQSQVAAAPAYGVWSASVRAACEVPSSAAASSAAWCSICIAPLKQRPHK